LVNLSFVIPYFLFLIFLNSSINKEPIIEGFENIPEAFIGLFEGTNTGKMMVKI